MTCFLMCPVKSLVLFTFYGPKFGGATPIGQRHFPIKTINAKINSLKSVCLFNLIDLDKEPMQDYTRSRLKKSAVWSFHLPPF